MNITAQTLDALEFPRIRESIAERAASDLGRERIASLTPSDNLVTIQAALRPVLEAMDLIAFDDPVSVHRIPDIRPTLRVVATPGSVLAINELCDVGDVLHATRRLDAYLDRRADKYPRLHALTSALTPHEALEQALADALDPATETVKDSASSELRSIRRGIEQIRSSIRDRVQAVLDKLPDTVVQDRLVTLRDGRYVIPVREAQKNTVNGIVHDQSQTGHTLFVEPMAAVELSNRLRQLEGAERHEVDRILRALSDRVAESRLDLEANLEILGRFDAVYAKAAFSRDLDCTEPVFNTEGRIHLRQARHPLLVHRMRREDKESDIVPLDLLLGTEDYWSLILTGPNAGGKTVTLKTTGLVALMAQSGLPIPAAPKSELPLFTAVFADIGDAQSIDNDLSTFSSHVANLTHICNGADGRSLVLLDEIGSSTDPDQGSALAMALLGTLTKRGARTIATTHHGALKAFAHQTNGIENGSMAFDAETLEPTFQLRLQVPGSSYAFEIARRFGMPEEVVAEAARIAGSEVGRVEDLIQKLDTTYKIYCNELDTVDAERKALSAEKADYDTRLADVEQRERAMQQTAHEEARRIVADANRLVEQTVADLRSRSADKQSIREAHQSLDRAREQIDEAIEAAEPEREAVQVARGDRVFISRLGQEGNVLTEPGSAGRVLVEVGALKVEVGPDELELRGQAAVDAEQKKSMVKVESGASDVDTDVDLRGLTVEEAQDVVDKYLDDLLLARLPRATIIHGKGTGVLRKQIGEFLKRHPYVKSQRLGHHNEGGSGVTVIELDVNS